MGHYRFYKRKAAFLVYIIQLLGYYGVGGIGKTSLLRQLTKEMDEKIEHALYAYIDLNIQRKTRPVLEELRNILYRDHNFDFPFYDFASYAYARKAGEKLEEDEKKDPQGLLQRLIDRSQTLKILREAFENIPIPIVGDIVSTIKRVDSVVGGIYDLFVQHQQEIDIIGMGPTEEIYKQLPVFFALDLEENLKNKKEPLVIFFDTYERLVNEISGVGDPLSEDIWIRGKNGLIQKTRRVMWVAAGRERLRWEERDPRWSGNVLKQDNLDYFKEPDARSFLQAAGIEDEALLTKIWDLTKGSPIYLNLCVDTYHSLPKKDGKPQIEKFDVAQDADAQEALVECFIRHMNDQYKEIVYLLSCIKTWNNDMFTVIAESVLHNWSRMSYENILGFSFIIKGDNDMYTMHQVVQQVIFKDCEKSHTWIKNEARKAKEKYYMKKLDDTSVTASESANLLTRYVDEITQSSDASPSIPSTERPAQAAQSVKESSSPALPTGESTKSELQVDKLSQDSTEEEFTQQYKGLSRRMNALRESYQFDLLLDRRGTLVEHADRTFPNAAVTARLHEDFAMDLVSAGEYQKALENHKRAIDIYCELCDKATDRNDLNALHTINELAPRFDFYPQMETFNLKDAKSEVIERQKKILEKCESFLSEDHPDRLMAMNNLAKTYSSLDSFEDALNLQEKVLEQRRKAGEDNPDTLTAMSDLAWTLYELGRYDEAFDNAFQVYTQRSKIFSEDNLDTIKSKSDLALICKKNDRLQTGLRYQNENLIKLREKGEDHPDTLTAISALADTYRDLNNPDEEVKLREDVLAKRRRVLGNNHPDTMRTIERMAQIYKENNRLQDELKLQEEILLKRRDILGDEHPDTIQCMDRIVQIYWTLDHKLVESCENVSGAGLTVDTAMNNLAWLYSNLGRHQEALDLWKKIRAKYEETYGEDDPKTIKAARNVAYAYGKLGCQKDEWKERELIYSRSKRVFGKISHETLAAVDELTETYIALHRNDEALELKKNYLKQCREDGLENTLDTIEAMESLARTDLRLGLRDVADIWQKEASKKRVKLFLEICKSGTAEEIHLAIDAGADVNATDKEGKTALILAAKYNTADVVTALIKRGAMVNKRAPNRRTALMEAAEHNTADAIAALINAKAKVDATVQDGKTALILAAEYNTADAVIALINAGANISKRENTNRSAIDYARKNEKLKDTDVFKLLGSKDQNHRPK